MDMIAPKIMESGGGANWAEWPHLTAVVLRIITVGWHWRRGTRSPLQRIEPAKNSDALPDWRSTVVRQTLI